jgi:hypothetical protein
VLAGHVHNYERYVYGGVIYIIRAQPCAFLAQLGGTLRPTFFQPNAGGAKPEGYLRPMTRIEIPRNYLTQSAGG